MAAEIIKWVIVGMLALNALVACTVVGKARKPITGGMAAWIVAVNAVYVVLIVVFWRNS